MMDFKETEIKGTATEPYMEIYISVIRGLIHYHERMTLLLNEQEKCGKNECPVLGYENDLYLKSLKIALELMESAMGETIFTELEKWLAVDGGTLLITADKYAEIKKKFT